MSTAHVHNGRFLALIVVIFLVAAHTVSGFCPTEAQQETLRKSVLKNGPTKKALDKIFQYDSDPYVALRLAGCNFYKSFSRLIATHHALPGLILKSINFDERLLKDSVMGIINRDRNVNRIILNAQVEECIRIHKLQSIVQPNKYLYHIPGRPEDFNDRNYIVVVDKLDVVCEECNNRFFAFYLTPPMEHEINMVIDYIGYYDAKPSNIRLLKNGKVSFIDTEPIFDIDFIDRLPGMGSLIKSLGASLGHERLESTRAQLRSEYRLRITNQGNSVAHRAINLCPSHPMECDHAVPCY